MFYTTRLPAASEFVEPQTLFRMPKREKSSLSFHLKKVAILYYWGEKDVSVIDMNPEHTQG